MQIHDTTGVATSYSTWTSTSYLQYTAYLTKTELAKKTTTTDRLFQYGGLGPYVEINGTWRQIANDKIEVDMIVKNLQDLPIKFGGVKFKIMILVPSPASDPFREADCIFVPVGEETREIRMKSIVTIVAALPWPHPTTVTELYIASVSIQLHKPTEIISTVPIATSEYSEARTITILSTYVTTLTEEPQVTGRPQSSFDYYNLLFPVMGAVVILFVLLLLKRKRGKDQVMKVVTEQRPVRTKYCSECGFVMLLEAKHCPKCGTEQHYFG
jgi:hypothetical protein